MTPVAPRTGFGFQSREVSSKRPFRPDSDYYSSRLKAITQSGTRFRIQTMKFFWTFSSLCAVSWLGLTSLFGAELPAPTVRESPEATGALKVIIDTDFNTIGDDGQVLVMAAQLAAQGRLDLLGVTLATGNQWLDQEQADALKAVERLGIEKQVRVYRGALYPLVHDYKAYLYEKQLFLGHDYVGAYATPSPTRGQLVPPPDGFAAHTQAAQKSAINFLIETIHQYPHEVNILAIGPLTNLALAIREDPTIVPLIRQIVFMGGQVDTIGNAFDDAGEFNWWFDPEAAKVVLRARSRTLSCHWTQPTPCHSPSRFSTGSPKRRTRRSS